MSVVIIGAGHAGVETADALRREGFEDSITVVDRSEQLPYQRPPLSKDYVQPGAEASPLPLRAERFYDDQQITLRLGRPVTAVDRDQKVVSFDDGSDLAYDTLVLATGAHERTATCPGSDLDGVLTLRTLADAERMRQELECAGRVVVVGAGFIGLEFASAAEQRGLPVTVIDLAERPMQRVLSPAMSAYFRQLHETAGARLVFGEAVAAFTGAGDRVGGVIGASGGNYPADLVVTGLGVVPADELAHAMGLEVDNGVAVDAHLRTSDPDVYAVGDCVSYPSIHGGRRLRLEAVQNATDHARCVARSITGRPEPYAAVPWFWTVQCGRKLQIAGLASPSMHTLTCGDLDSGKASVLGFDSGRLVCVESLGAPADHLAARRLLTGASGLTPDRAAEPDFSLKAFAKTLPAA